VYGALLLVALSLGQNPSAGDPRARHDPLPDRRAVSVLFVGNSLTYVNDLPHLTERFTASSPLHTALTVGSVVSGGAPLSEHWRKGEVRRALGLHRPDVLVLQGQSTEPLTAQGDFFHYAELLKTEADKVGARTILFETWARPPGDPFYSEPVSGGSPAVMQSRLSDAYSWLATRLHVELAPIGQAFASAQARLPGVPLLDGSQHPTLAGSYLAAAVLFRALFHESPVNATYTAGIPAAAAVSLREIAAQER
jgi:hypothetical protein